MHRRKQLFGGALYGAGVIAAASQAAGAGANDLPFAPGENNSVWVGINPASYSFHSYGQYSDLAFDFLDSISAVGGPTGPLNLNYMGTGTGTVNSYASITNNTVTVSTSGVTTTYFYYGYSGLYDGDWGTAGVAQAFVYLAPTSDITLRVEWDSSHGSTFARGGIYIFSPGGFFDTFFGSGELIFTLEGGSTYAILLHGCTRTSAIQDPDFDPHFFAQLTIVPAPGALALLGIASMVGKRRRRE